MDKEYYIKRIAYLEDGIRNGSLCKKDTRNEIGKARRQLEKLDPYYRKHDKFIVTGVTRDGKRFKRQYAGTDQGYIYAMNINLWRGTVWALLNSGRKFKMKEVYN